MRLVQIGNEGELSLVEFIGDDHPPYAILSHTWSQTNKEVTFAAFVSGECAENSDYAKSYEKIRRCGQQAAKDGLKHFWVDTCCINKESSAELSEAINSMYRWYRDADACYAYLNDVHHKLEFRKSRWFKRGWTLQEVLAPADVIFFDASWSMIGFKTSLITTLSERTGIDARALHDGTSLNDFSIAERMSWAAGRQTSRIEDEAYCLLGILDVNMPLIYGEGKRAFIRLQEELLKSSNDASILAYIAHKAKIPSAIASTESFERRLSPQASDINDIRFSDEAPLIGTTGLFANRASLFEYSKDYIFHPTLSSKLESSNLAPLASRIRRSGHLVEFVGLLWQPNASKWPKHLTKTDVVGLQAHIENEYGIDFTASSIKKLALCIKQDCDWAVALLDCRRRDGGIVGIMLQHNTDRGTYTRLHAPSIVETYSTSLEYATGFVVRTIDIEADAVRFIKPYLSTTEYLARQTNLRNHVIYRTTNFSDYGLSHYSKGPGLQYSTEYRATGPYDIPRIVFIKNPVNANEEEGVSCTLLANQKILDRIDLMGLSIQDCVLVPTSRGSTTRISLNKELQLVIRSRLQWDCIDVDNSFYKSKLCLLILSIEESKNTSEESLLLDDGSDNPPPLLTD
ncbi:hypothetical protein OPT61_g2993 [Boeremia exigua]|uniref:Uncharacterized protein n=1 Tax=Boeremia exigua TaxID=749465 RepID=A0ACC2IJG1_9PLEO|nr:hypothetical protein OPT61_g2993 [Boeremia exigua]